MSARPITKASLAFGLVALPIRVYSTTRTARTRFSMIDPASGEKVVTRYANPITGEEIPRGDLLRGFEVSRGEYVTFTPQEIKDAKPAPTRSVEISEFVPVDEIPRSLVRSTYWVGPDKGGEKSYSLLVAALERTGTAAIGELTIRSRRQLTAIRPSEGGLVAEVLKFATEVRETSELPRSEDVVTDAELDLACQIVEQKRVDRFDHASYPDRDEDAMRALVEAKVAGHTPSPVKPQGAPVIDLMERLRASIKKAS